MEHYKVLSNLDRGKRNALMPSFNPSEIIKLEKLLNLKNFYGDDKSYSEIMSEINLNEVSPERKNRREATLNVDGTQHTASSFLASFVEFEGDLVGNDPIIQTMYEDAVNMLASNGASQAEYKRIKLKKIISQSFG